MPNVSFFSKRGPKIPNLLQTAIVKNWMRNAQIPKDHINGRVVVNQSLNKMLI